MFNKNNLLKELVNIKAFSANKTGFTHFSQDAFIQSYKNNYTFYNIPLCFKLFKRALKFLKLSLAKENTKLIVVGSPLEETIIDSEFFQGLKLKFFPTDQWEPGYLSKIANPKNCILLIYNPSTNNMALSEAVNLNVPVVGFPTPNCDIRPLDYPIILNLEVSGFWFFSLCHALSKIRRPGIKRGNLPKSLKRKKFLTSKKIKTNK